MALVAKVDGEVVGHVSGIGGALVRAVLEVANERGEPLVVLEGSPAYCGQLRFEHSLRHGIEIDLPDSAPPEAAQVFRLAAYDSADPSLKER